MLPTEENEKKIGLILLAAGASVRLGRPKQLLAYHNETLLQHSVEIVMASDVHPVVVVLGANADTLHKQISNVAVHVVVNSDWEEGMASSIRCGIKGLTELRPDADGMILMMCDQPYVTSALLAELIATQQRTGKKIVACAYENTFGPPVFFHRTLFDELLQLKGDIGARNIIRQHPDMIEIIPFPEGMFDIDSEADYERIKAGNIL